MSSWLRPSDIWARIKDAERRLKALEVRKQSTGATPGAHTHSHDADLTGVSVDDHHARDHSVIGSTHTSFPGGTTNFLRADGAFAAPGGGGALASAMATRTSGAPTLNSTSWANVDTGLDLVLAAAATDIVLVGISTAWQNEAVVARLDVGTLVSGSIVNYFGGATDPSSGYGIPSWFGNSGVYDVIGSPTARTLVAGDISGGNVTLRLRYKTDTATNKTMNATADAPLVFWAVNLG